MIYSEKEYKLLLEEIKKLKKENEIKSKENKLLKQQNKQQAEVIHDLDINDYRGQCETLKLENLELKKKLKVYEEKFEISRISLGKNSNNSLKPSSTNGFVKVVQNNRVKSGKAPGREKGHKRSAPEVTKTPDKVVTVRKVATCTCGAKTIENGTTKRDLVSLEVLVHTTQYVGQKTKCPCCKKEYNPKFPSNVTSIVNYDEKVKAIVLYLNSYCNVPNQKVVETLNFLGKEKIKMSQGNVGNIAKQFNKKSEDIGLSTLFCTIFIRTLFYIQLVLNNSMNYVF